MLFLEAGVIGVFLGVWLALIADRRRQSRRAVERERERAAQFVRSRQTVLGSVVKNTGEATRLRACELLPRGIVIAYDEGDVGHGK